MRKFEKECRAYAERVGLDVTCDGNAATFTTLEGSYVDLRVERHGSMYLAALSLTSPWCCGYDLATAISGACTMYGERQANVYHEAYVEGVQ